MSLRDKMLAVMADVNASVAEREELVELIVQTVRIMPAIPVGRIVRV